MILSFVSDEKEVKYPVKHRASEQQALKCAGNSHCALSRANLLLVNYGGEAECSQVAITLKFGSGEKKEKNPS